MSKKIIIKIGLWIGGIVIASELVLRFVLGFCNAPLYIADPDFEYVYAPNQYRYRFRNVVKTNAFSMRSEPINTADTTVVLLIGDSVVNGGNLSDHDGLASTILERKLSKHYAQTVRVLNITAGSWGPDNVFAFLKKKGFFGADLVCLVTSSHDAYDNMTHQPIVGININYPEKQYKIALYELYDRYWWMVGVNAENLLGPITQYAPQDMVVKLGTTFNVGFQQLTDTTRAMHIPFVMYLHPETSEIKAGRYDKQGKEIIAFAKKNHIPLMQELALNPDLAMYREYDTVHYNEHGQAFMARQLFPIFKQYLDQYFHARTHRPQSTVGAL